MPSTVNEQLMDEVTSGNLKVLADMAQGALAQSIQNQVNNQAHIQAIQAATLQNGLTLAQDAVAQSLALSRMVTGKVLRYVADTSAEQATAFAQQIASDANETLAQAGATLSAVQQESKIAQSTAPQTGTGGAFGSETGLSQQIALALSNLAAGQAAIVELLRGARPAP